MAADVVSVRIQSTENVSKSTKKVRNALDQLEKKSLKMEGAFGRLKLAGTEMKNELKKMATSGLGAAAALAGLVKFAKDSVSAFMVQEKAEHDLAVAMKNMGTYTNEAYEELKNYASARQEVTVYGDELNLSIMANLQSYGMEIETLKKATEAAQDLATAKGIDLKTASDLIGKAFVGETGSLSRYGIVLDKSILKTEKFAAVIELLTDRFGGAAQAEIETYSGQLKQLSNWWGDIMEKIGFGLIKALEAAQVAVGFFVGGFLKLFQVITIGQSKIPLLGDGLDLVAEKLGELTGEVNEFTTKNVKMLLSNKEAADSFKKTNKEMKKTIEIQKTLNKTLAGYAGKIDEVGDMYLEFAQTRFDDDLKSQKSLNDLQDSMRRYQAVIQETYKTRHAMQMEIVKDIEREKTSLKNVQEASINAIRTEMAGKEQLLQTYRNYYNTLSALRLKNLEEYKKTLNEIKAFESETLKTREELNGIVRELSGETTEENKDKWELYYDAVQTLDKQYTDALKLTGKEKSDALAEYIRTVKKLSEEQEAIKTGFPPEGIGIISDSALNRVQKAQGEWEKVRTEITQTMKESADKSKKAMDDTQKAMDGTEKKIKALTDMILKMKAEIEKIQSEIVIKVNDFASPAVFQIRKSLRELHDKTITVTTIHRNVQAGSGEAPNFHNGTPSVPQTGTYLLERGEAVIPANQNPHNDNRRVDNRQFTVNFNGSSSQSNPFEDEQKMMRFFKRASNQMV